MVNGENLKRINFDLWIRDDGQGLIVCEQQQYIQQM